MQQVTKEVKAGNYRLSSFFLARTAVSVPFESAIAIIFTVIIYNMIGFQAVASKYFVFMVVLVLVNLISEMVGFIGGIVTKVRTPLAKNRLKVTLPVGLTTCSASRCPA